MGLLDGMLENVVSSALKGGQDRGASNPLGDLLGQLGAGAGTSAQAQAQAGAAPGLDASKLLAAGLALLQQNGGIAGLVESLNRNGLAEQASSWIGTGTNKAITAEQLQNALGDQALGKIASQLGLSPQQAGSSMAQLLPELINQLTPKGNVPADHAELVSQGLSMLLGRR